MRAVARNERQRRPELRNQIGEIGELSVMAAVAEHDGAFGSRMLLEQCLDPPDKLRTRHALGVPVGRTNQQRRVYRQHRRLHGIKTRSLPGPTWLDPAIHLLTKTMDPRVKPAGDAEFGGRKGNIVLAADDP